MTNENTLTIADIDAYRQCLHDIHRLASIKKISMVTNNNSRVAIYQTKTLSGSIHTGWHYVLDSVQVGDRFHFDHGVGIQKNLDGQYIWIASSVREPMLYEVSDFLQDLILREGYNISGPIDSRAAEDGEPVWVCRARELISQLQA